MLWPDGVAGIGRKGQEKCVKIETICTVPSMCLCSEAGLCTYSVGLGDASYIAVGQPLGVVLLTTPSSTSLPPS